MSLPKPLVDAVVPEQVLEVASRLTERGFRAFLVGGCVRDILRGVPPKDWDVATSAEPRAVQRSFDKVIPTGIQHGTVTVVTRGTHVEVTTFRTEGEYVDGRRPSAVEFRTDIKDDLSRRDFTINAMAYDPVKKELVDPFGGQTDLAAKLIRAVGDPLDRFGEDGLRALRAVRFAAVLGFEIEPSTLGAIPRTITVFKKVSHERIHDELVKLLLSPRPRRGLELLRDTGLLAAFFPELFEQVGFQKGLALDLFTLSTLTVERVPAVLELRLAALLCEVGRPRTATPAGDTFRFPDHDRLGADLCREALSRLKFPNKTVDKVALLVREHSVAISAPWSDGQLRRFAARVRPEHLADLFTVIAAQSDALGETARRKQIDDFKNRLDALLAKKPALEPKGLALNGGDIMKVLNAQAGPVIGEATRHLMELVLEKPELNSRDELSDALRKWAENRGV